MSHVEDCSAAQTQGDGVAFSTVERWSSAVVEDELLPRPFAFCLRITSRIHDMYLKS